jgi:hypothetical protein
MKKILYLVVILFSIACQKEEILTPEIVHISEYNNEFGKFRKELIIYDESGQNSILLLLHTNFSGIIEHYLQHNELKLVIDITDEMPSLKSSSIEKQMAESSVNALIPEDILKRPLSIELITENIKEDVKNYYLNVQSKKLQLKSDFIFNANYYVSYTTTGDLIGVSNYGAWSDEDKWDIYCYLEKKNHWYTGWDILWQGFLQGHIYDNLYYAQLDYTGSGNPWNKIGAGLYTDPRVPVYNFLIAYYKSSFRGHSCTIGSYDTRNCFVGTAPSGTTAFMYPNAQGGFYYTPVNGNQCPYPGSTFDTENCFVIDIPSSCEGFIASNSWYVKTDIIN